MGTDNDRVTRLLGGTDKRKMGAVAAYYLQTYGNSLVEDLKDELSGTFLKVRRLCVCASMCLLSGWGRHLAVLDAYRKFSYYVILLLVFDILFVWLRLCNPRAYDWVVVKLFALSLSVLSASLVSLV